MCDHDPKECEECQARDRLEKTWTNLTLKALERARKTIRHAQDRRAPPHPLGSVAPAPG